MVSFWVRLGLGLELRLGLGLVLVLVSVMVRFSVNPNPNPTLKQTTRFSPLAVSALLGSHLATTVSLHQNVNKHLCALGSWAKARELGMGVVTLFTEQN